MQFRYILLNVKPLPLPQDLTMESTIEINVSLDGTRMPEKISWSASDSTANEKREAKAMILGFWDGADKTALRIDLWTREMMVDEMTDFFYQTMMTMADTYNRSTKQTELVNDIKQFAESFYKKFQQSQLNTNKA
jgi:gliding motility-associated protein GldC